MLAQMAIALRPHLSRFKHPKYWISVDHLPRTAQEKLQRADLKAIAHQWMTQHATPKP
jgi:O-succinylbenzoic acid--CoA ligase